MRLSLRSLSLKSLLKSLSLKPLDLVVLVLGVLLTLGFSYRVYARSRSEPMVVIQGRTQSWVFPLSAQERVSVDGPLGNTVVRIEGGTVRVESSPCSNQTCVAAGEIHDHGQWVACLPNQVSIRVEGKREEDELDASTW